MPQDKNPAAVLLGKLGGAKRSAQKTAAAQANGRNGGRPKKPSGVKAHEGATPQPKPNQSQSPGLTTPALRETPKKPGFWSTYERQGQ